jgi:hypothetical protein
MSNTNLSKVPAAKAGAFSGLRFLIVIAIALALGAMLNAR